MTRRQLPFGSKLNLLSPTAWSAEHMSTFNTIYTNSEGSGGRADATVQQAEDF
jgi:hypothetical protein